MSPRSLQDRSFFCRFRVRLGCQNGPQKWHRPAAGVCLGGSRPALVWCFVCLVARVRFFDPLALFLGPFWDGFGPVLGLLGASRASLRLCGALLGFSLGAFGKFGGPRTSATRTMPWPGGLREAITSAAPWLAKARSVSNRLSKLSRLVPGGPVFPLGRRP